MTAIDHRYDFVLLFDVATGNPNGEGSPRWRPYNAHSRYVQNFAGQFGRVDGFSEHRCGFWETQPLPASFIVDN